MRTYETSSGSKQPKKGDRDTQGPINIILKEIHATALQQHRNKQITILVVV